MKKLTLLLLSISLTHSFSAQNLHKRMWFDLQVSQHIGLNSWSSFGYVNDGLPKAMLTELRGVYNISLIRSYVGGFADIGLGITPAPKMKSLALDQMPMPHNGTPYFLREILSETGNNSANAHLKMTFGLFGIIPVKKDFLILPYFGAGFVTMPERKYEIILKEQGSNMQYQTIYKWNYYSSYDYNEDNSLSYLTGRVNFKYGIANKSTILFGLEYTFFLNTLDFYGKFTNTFNTNIERSFKVKGNKMNMLGITVGISFM